MGLFERAVSLAKAPAPKRRGLLQRSRMLRERELPAEGPASPKLTQDELDEVLNRRSGSDNGKGRSPVRTRKKGAVELHVPLTWQEAGLQAPKELKVSIDPGELDRLAGTVEETALETAPPAPEDPLALLEREAERIEEGIEAPAQLFGLLRDRLGFGKAAFLLYDPLRMVFAPWTSVGFDATSQARLRIPLGYNPAFNRVANGDALLLSERGDLDSFKGCFSAREFGQIQQLLLVPSIHEGKLIAVLLVALASPLSNPEIPSRLLEICRRISPLLFRSREQKLGNVTVKPWEDRESLEEQVQKLSEEAEASTRSLLLVRISLEGVLQGILGPHPYLDPFRLREDLYMLIGSQFRGTGRLYPLDENRVLLLVDRMKEPDPQLLIHQIGLLLSAFFRTLRRLPQLEIPADSRILPIPGRDPLALLSELL